MNEIYFTDKGHTRKLNIPNIWPTKENAYAPAEFFHGKKLVLLVDPVLVDRTFYTATFQIYDAERMRYTTFNVVDAPPRIISSGIMWASLGKGHLEISTRTTTVYGMLDLDDVEKNRFWALRDEALKLLREGIEEFNKYFPVQSYKK